jgi:CheY-like chemotaxis protein
LVFILVSDPLFLSTIEAASGGNCLALADEETLWAALQEGTPGAIFMEIGVLNLDGAELIQKLKQNPATQKIPIVAFGNSLRADLLQDAREAGADLVLPKAAFR